MTCKTKTTLTRAERERIKKTNTQRLRAAKEQSVEKMSEADRENEKKDKKEQGIDNGKGKDRKEREIIKSRTGKGMKRGMKALKEIQRYKTSTDLLIRRLPF